MKPKMKTRRSHAAPQIEEVKRPNSLSRFVDERTGEFNASSKKDLADAFMQLSSMISSGQVENNSQRKVRTAEEARMSRQVCAAAYADKRGGSWDALGAQMGKGLSITAQRDGFMRRLLIQEPISTGEEVRIRVKQMSVLGVTAGDVGSVRPQFIKERYVRPPEFYVATNIVIEQKDIVQGQGDILEDKFFEGEEAIMIQEDITFKNMADALVGTYNPQMVFSGGLTPNYLGAMHAAIDSWGLSPSTLLMASDGMQDLRGTNYSTWFDPVSQYEIVMTGKIGSLLGTSIITDAFREPRQKVLSQGDIYLLAPPENLGAFTDRGEVESTATDGALLGRPTRGWYLRELISMTVLNGRGVVKGVRV